MPVRHFYLLSHYICNGLFFLFSVCWLHVNEFNSLGGIKGERSEDYCYPESMPVQHFYLLSHYIYNGLLFLFSVCWLHVNEFNSLGGIKGEWSEVYCYPESMPAGIFTCSHITFAMVYYFYFLCVGST